MTSDRQLLDLTIETLEDAIPKLRAEAAVASRYGQTDRLLEVANDLAMLHLRLATELKQADEELERRAYLPHKSRLSLVDKRERIAAEVERGEHRDD